jgi:hypothetical protein
MKQYLNRSLTVRQTLAVIFTLAALAALGYLAYEFVSAKVLEAKVAAATPRVCASIREQRQVLLSAIEAYRAHYGFYPLDNVISREPLVVDPVNNPLLYELAGVVSNSASKTFDLAGLEPADAHYVLDFFHFKGFNNSAENSSGLRRFLENEHLPARQLHDDPDVFALGFTRLYGDLPEEVLWELQVSPWRYVSSSPTNNPGRFDLWIEIRTRSQTITIGNWAAAE